MRQISNPSALAVILFAIAAAAVPATAEETMWRVFEDDCRQKSIQHRRESETGAGAAVSYDYFKSFCGQGSFAHAAIPIEPVSIISELHIDVPMRSTHTGHQVLARVVLPRSLDPKTGEPLTMMIPGTSYNTTGKWQSVVLSQLDRKIAHHVRLCLLYTSPSPRDKRQSRMPSSA